MAYSSVLEVGGRRITLWVRGPAIPASQAKLRFTDPQTGKATTITTGITAWAGSPDGPIPADGIEAEVVE